MPLYLVPISNALCHDACICSFACSCPFDLDWKLRDVLSAAFVHPFPVLLEIQTIIPMDAFGFHQGICMGHHLDCLVMVDCNTDNRQPI